MLYATTRGKHDVVTAYKAAHTDCYSDGGLYVPFRMPKFQKEQLEQLADTAPAQIVADVLNLFFSCDLTASDVDNAATHRPVECVPLGRRLLVAELWHNSQGDVSQVIRRLSDRVCGGKRGVVPSNWMQIAVRIALLFASYGSLLSSNQLRVHRLFDVAVTGGDFAMPMAAWYARQMGLPVGNIICGCNSNGSFWDLLNRGEFSTGDIVTVTSTPEADIVVPRNLERLICATLGVEETKKYLLCCSKGRTYRLSEELLHSLGKGMFAAVISDSRVASIIPGVYHTCSYVLGPYAALAYGSLQDYRAMTGHTNPALLVAEHSPVKNRQQVSQLLQIQENELKNFVSR